MSEHTTGRRSDATDSTTGGPADSGTGASGPTGAVTPVAESPGAEAELTARQRKVLEVISTSVN